MTSLLITAQPLNADGAGVSAVATTNDVAGAANADDIDLSPEATVLRHYTQSNFIVQDADAESVIQSYLNAFSMAYDPHTAYIGEIVSAYIIREDEPQNP